MYARRAYRNFQFLNFPNTRQSTCRKFRPSAKPSNLEMQLQGISKSSNFQMAVFHRKRENTANKALLSQVLGAEMRGSPLWIPTARSLFQGLFSVVVLQFNFSHQIFMLISFPCLKSGFLCFWCRPRFYSGQEAEVLDLTVKCNCSGVLCFQCLWVSSNA